MTDNMTIVQEIKRYLHESKPNPDNSIDVNLSDFPYERRDVFFGLGMLQTYGYLKIICLMAVPGGHWEENKVPITDIDKDNGLNYAKVVLAEHYGNIDETFELKWDSVGREVWADKVFIKGFSPIGGAYMNAFVYSYEHSGISLIADDFCSVLGTKEVPRLDTMITVALDTLSRNSVKWWYRELGSKKVRCERIYWKSEEEELDFVKQPKHYELDPYERGEWSDD